MRYRRRRHLVDPHLHRTLRHPPRRERDRGTERDGHTVDATDPDQRRDANLDTAANLDAAADVGGGAAGNLDLNAVGCCRAGFRRGRRPGRLGWILLVALVAGLIGGLVIWRARRHSAWDAEAAALEVDTRTITSTRLPSVLTAETAGQRALSWPPLRATMIELIGRWDLLAERASDDRRRHRAGQIHSLLQELVAAVDAENEALATGRDWRLLRPRVDEVERALSALLARVPPQEPPPGGYPGQPPPGQWQPPDAVQ